MYSIPLALLVVVLSTACASNRHKSDQYYQIKSENKIPISVTQFKNRSAQTGNNGHCRGWLWFNSDLGNAFQDLAVSQLQNYSKLNVLERDTIHKIYDNEVNLVNSEKSVAIEKGHFKKAKYTIVGVVNSFEYCSGNTGIKAASVLTKTLFGADVDRETAKVEINLRLIETKTGEVIATASGVGEQSRTSASFDALNKNIDVGSQIFLQSSLSDAIKEAIHQGTEDLLAKSKL
jgi:curli biogenesis system outer membrane secretion channel CsgG